MLRTCVVIGPRLSLRACDGCLSWRHFPDFWIGGGAQALLASSASTAASASSPPVGGNTVRCISVFVSALVHRARRHLTHHVGALPSRPRLALCSGFAPCPCHRRRSQSRHLLHDGLRPYVFVHVRNTSSLLARLAVPHRLRRLAVALSSAIATTISGESPTRRCSSTGHRFHQLVLRVVG